MKTRILLLVLGTAITAAFTLVSCNKNNTEPDPTPRNHIIRTITTDEYTANFIYNESEELLTGIDFDYGTSQVNVTYDWSESNVDITAASEDYSIVYSFTLENGRATSMLSDGENMATFEYSADGTLSKVIWSDGSTDTYTWTDGDMTAISGILNTQIEYGKIVNNTNLNLIHLISPGDLNSMIQPYGSITGIMGKPSAHMPESEKCNYEDYGSQDISYSYTLDDDGRITAVDISSGGQKSTVKIGY